MGKKGLFMLVSVAFYDLHFKRSLCKAECHLREKEAIWFINFFPLTGQTNCENIKTWKTNFLWKKTKTVLFRTGYWTQDIGLSCKGRSNILVLLHICILSNIQVEDWKRGKERVYRKNKDEYSEGQEGRARVCEIQTEDKNNNKQ